jgi:hypothetical protein
MLSVTLVFTLDGSSKLVYRQSVPSGVLEDFEGYWVMAEQKMQMRQR